MSTRNRCVTCRFCGYTIRNGCGGVALKSHGGGSVSDFGSIIDIWPNVVEWSRTSGSWDFLLKFLVRDTQHHDELHNKLLALPEVSRVRGMHVIGSSKVKPVAI